MCLKLRESNKKTRTRRTLRQAPCGVLKLVTRVRAKVPRDAAGGVRVAGWAKTRRWRIKTLLAIVRRARRPLEMAMTRGREKALRPLASTIRGLPEFHEVERGEKEATVVVV